VLVVGLGLAGFVDLVYRTFKKKIRVLVGKGSDGAAMAWLGKQYPYWKSKVKAKPKNKCP
jgi:ABC-type uncharacterized transport system permease subunit